MLVGFAPLMSDMLVTFLMLVTLTYDSWKIFHTCLQRFAYLCELLRAICFAAGKNLDWRDFYRLTLLIWFQINQKNTGKRYSSASK